MSNHALFDANDKQNFAHDDHYTFANNARVAKAVGEMATRLSGAAN